MSPEGTVRVRTKLIVPFAVVVLIFGMVSSAGAITWGRPDVNNEYPNVASVRGIVEAQNLARVSCSGSLLQRDADKVVILTAAHCTDAWAAEIAAGTLDSVGVSFDQNNQVNGTTTDATVYVRGGVPISFPAKDAPFETFDYGLVVFAADAENSLGQTIQERWGALTPVQVAPDPGYVSRVIASVPNPTNNLSFTAVGYGTGEKFPIPGQETGPADPSGANTSKFLIRYIAEGMTYNAHNPVNDVLRLSMNIAKGENGTCNGDSGGPIFYEDPTLGEVQVSLVSGGDAPCRATNTGPGFGYPEALDFIACGTVEGDVSAVMACVDDLFRS
jgi:Trypsin